MDITVLTLFLGITSLILLAIGYTYAVLFMIKYIYVKKILVPIVAVVAFVCGSFYLGPSVSFISLITTGENITPHLYYLISYIWMPIGTISIVLMALTVFKPSARKFAIIFYGIMAVVYWVAMFGFTDQQYTAEPPLPGELLDISHANVSLIITAITLVSVLIIDSGGFFFLARKLKRENFPKKDIQKAFTISLGWLLFVISGILDALVSLNSVVGIIVVRGLMMVAFNLIYLGFWSKPVKLEKEIKE